jgi:hypothetical protein
MMIEFALIVPLILLALFSLFEATHWMQIKQRVIMLSREAANATYRNCSFHNERASFSHDACLSQVRDRVNNFALRLFPDFNERGLIIVSLYQHTEAEGVQRKSIIPVTGGNGSFSTQFNSSNADLGNVARDQGQIVFGEAFYQLNFITPVSAIFNLMGMNAPILGACYEATVF